MLQAILHPPRPKVAGVLAPRCQPGTTSEREREIDIERESVRERERDEKR